MSSDMNKTTVNVDNGSFSKRVEMPLFVATELKHKLISTGGKIIQNNVYTNGPRTLFKILIELSKNIDVYTKNIWSIKIYGEFINGETTGDVNIEYEHKLTHSVPSGGFIHDAVAEFYKENILPDVMKYIMKENVRELIGDLNDIENKGNTKIKKK